MKKEQKIIILNHVKVSQALWLNKELKFLGKELIFIDNDLYLNDDYKTKWGRMIYLPKYFKIAKKAIAISKENDIILSMNFTIGFFVALIAMFKFKKRKILALNFIAYDNSKLDFLKTPLFRFLFLKGLKSTVNSEDHIGKYNKKFKLNGKKVFSILNDVYDGTQLKTTNLPGNSNEPFCFSGGEANRDWRTFLTAAEKCSNLNFKIIARKYMWNMNLKIPSNVKVSFDEPKEKFNSEVLNSEFLIIPLKTDIVAGLTVLIQAILMCKFVIVTDSSAVRKYIPRDCEDILVPKNDPQALIKKITYFHNNLEERNRIIKKMYENLINNFSPQNYAKNIVQIMYEIKFI